MTDWYDSGEPHGQKKTGSHPSVGWGSKMLHHCHAALTLYIALEVNHLPSDKYNKNDKTHSCKTNDTDSSHVKYLQIRVAIKSVIHHGIIRASKYSKIRLLVGNTSSCHTQTVIFLQD
jgi:hypothetical protein